MNQATDYAGSIVTVGCLVRVLSVDAQFLRSLPSDEREHVQSMVGSEFTVYEVTEHGYAMVEKVFKTGPGESTSHSIALAPEEMVLVNRVA